MSVNFMIMDSFGKSFGSNGLLGGGFADAVSGDRWYWPDASVERALNDLMVVNGIKTRFCYLQMPVNEPSAPATITSLINNGTIRAGDGIVLEDAGDIPDNSNTVVATYNSVISAANQSGIGVKFLTTFDTSIAAWQAMGYGSPPMDSRFDRTLSLGSPARSGNQCIRDAMTANYLTATECAADMLYAAQVMYGHTNLRIVQSDWVHPNMWGQWRFERNILVATGLASAVMNIDPVKARVAANWQALQYNAPSNYWSQANALKAIDFCLRNVVP